MMETVVMAGAGLAALVSMNLFEIKKLMEHEEKIARIGQSLKIKSTDLH